MIMTKSITGKVAKVNSGTFYGCHFKKANN